VGIDVGLLLLRLMVGPLLIGHGCQKAWGWFHGPGRAVATAMFNDWGFRPARVMVVIAATCEIAAGILVTTGLAVTFAAAIMIGTLAVACSATATHGLWAARGGVETGLLYGWIGVVLAFTGPGRYSIDRLLDTPHGPGLGVIAVVVGLLAGAPPIVRSRRNLTARHRPATEEPATTK
jgi:putative oxidoreductase